MSNQYSISHMTINKSPSPEIHRTASQDHAALARRIGGFLVKGSIVAEVVGGLLASLNGQTEIAATLLTAAGVTSAGYEIAENLSEAWVVAGILDKQSRPPEAAPVLPPGTA